MMGPYQELAPKEACEAIRAGQVTVVDVRSPDEYSRGHIPGAQLVPLGELPARLEDLPEAEPIVTVCASGARSSQAAAFLSQAQFDEIYNLSGGMVAWQMSGCPVEKS